MMMMVSMVVMVAAVKVVAVVVTVVAERVPIAKSVMVICAPEVAVRPRRITLAGVIMMAVPFVSGSAFSLKSRESIVLNLPLVRDYKSKTKKI